MAAKIVAFVCLQFALFNTISAQCLNRVLPGCNSNLLPLPVPVAETIVPNQMVFSPNYQPIVEVPYGMETIVSNPVMPATTIIQDSTVANNLANALQLLVVSNLLSNTLPTSNEIVVPAFGTNLDYGVMSPIGPVVSPIGPVVSPMGPIVSPINPIFSPINSCGCGPYNYIY